MTKKVFWDDPYKTSLDTIVETVHGHEVTLCATIFYAFSGGQESDSGTIGGEKVLDARAREYDIVYTLREGHALREGQGARIEIDWIRRYRLMRLHFAAELVLVLFYKKFPAVEKIGAHIAQDKARLDFALPISISPYLSEFSAALADLVSSDLPVISAFENEASGKRYWEIEGFARVPCGGTHIGRTGEIGAPLTLKRNNIGRGKERVEIYLD